MKGLWNAFVKFVTYSEDTSTKEYLENRKERKPIFDYYIHVYLEDKKLIDIKNKTVYNINKNIFENFRYSWFEKEIIEKERPSDRICLNNRSIREIHSFDEYEEYIKYNGIECNCEIGSGEPNIKISKFYDEEEFNEMQDEYYIEFSRGERLQSTYNVWNNCTYDLIGTITLSLGIGRYKQKACLKCKTCLDEKNNMKKDIERKIEIEIEKNRKAKEEIEEVRMICEG